VDHPRQVATSPLNAICPYYTMFPVEFPLRHLRRALRKDVVVDPFCGRGTTLFAARLLGLGAIGIDSNPVATAIAESKLLSVRTGDLVRACREIFDEGSGSGCVHVPSGEFWERCYAPGTLRQICLVRNALQSNCLSPSRRALRALLLGRLHGPLTKHAPSYLSNQMPRTYAAKPAYAVRFWRERRMRPPEVDLVELVTRKAEYYFSNRLPGPRGAVLCADSRNVDLGNHPRARWVITSPPYYGMRSYVPDQWLRYWFLGGPEDVAYSFDSQLQHSSSGAFSKQLALVWKNVASTCIRGARMVIRFGGIHDRDADPREILRESLVDTGWHLTTAKAAGLASKGRRQAEQFQAKPNAPIEEYDFYARLA
jgi:hypothetical protein